MTALRNASEFRRDDGSPVYERTVSPGITVNRFGTLATTAPVESGSLAAGLAKYDRI